MSPPVRVRKLSVAEAAYVAGIIDGEGTVTMTAAHAGKNRRLVISVASTERALLEYLQKIIGAGEITGKRSYSNRHSPSHAYALSSRQAIDLLEQIAPYLRTYKKHRARLVLDCYIALTPRNGKYSAPQHAARADFVRRLLAILPNEGIRRNSRHQAR